MMEMKLVIEQSSDGTFPARSFDRESQIAGSEFLVCSGSFDEVVDLYQRLKERFLDAPVTVQISSGSSAQMIVHTARWVTTHLWKASPINEEATAA
jgi:hypothetical protein